MRIGIFGGTFNPVHTGHLIVAQLAKEQLQLVRVLFLLSPNSPHKLQQDKAEISHRLKMLQLAVAENPGFEICTLELSRAGASYTIDSLRALHASPDHRDAVFYLILGMDNLAEFHLWHSPDEIVKLARLAVYPRRTFSHEQVEPRFRVNAVNLQLPLIEISSTDIRQRVSQNASIRYLVPDRVLEYIESHRLYRPA